MRVYLEVRHNETDEWGTLRSQIADTSKAISKVYSYLRLQKEQWTNNVRGTFGNASFRYMMDNHDPRTSQTIERVPLVIPTVQ